MSDDYSDEESSTESTSSSEEDENASGWTEEVEKAFLRTLSALKRKDPKIYDENYKFFGDEPIDAKPPSAPKEEPLFLKDYERKVILERNGILSEEESDGDEAIEDTNKRAQSPSYVEQQRILKENFIKAANNDSSDDETGSFLKLKVKTAEEKIKEEKDYIEWLKGQKDELEDKEMENDLKSLRDYWTDPNLDEGEKFIRDYLLNRRHLEPNQSSFKLDEVSLSEEEKQLEECEEYEHQFNFRFEEPDKNFIKTYPRVIESSLRQRDEKRKLKREKLKKRKEEEFAKKKLEVKKLQKEKKQELLDKIKKLKEITGNNELGFNDEELENDFNPDEYDKRMAELFKEEFYELDDLNDEKPQFSDSDSPEEEKKTRSSRRKGHKKSKIAEEISKEKPVFNPSEKSFQQYLDEYYNLDFEDIIDDMPCRFQYRKVPANDFGLSVEEILAADDKELNNWCSMKKIDTIRPENQEKFDKKAYAKKAKDLNLKRKLLPSIFEEEQEDITESPQNIQSTKQKQQVTDNKQQDTTKPIQTEKKSKRKRKRKLLPSDVKEEPGISESSQNASSSNQKHVSGDKQQDITQSIQTQNKSKRRRKRKPLPNSFKENQDVTESPQKTPSSKQKQQATGKKQLDVTQPIQTQKKSKRKRKATNDLCDTSTKKSFKGNNFSHQKWNVSNKKDRTDACEFADERLKAYGINPKRYKNKLKYAPK